MSRLFENIRACVGADRYLFSSHADDMMRARRLVPWQIVSGILDGRLIVERPSDTPNPIVEVEQTLADGTPVKAVWAHVREGNVALLVTVHFFDR